MEEEIEKLLDMTRTYLKSALGGKKIVAHGHYGGFANMPPVVKMYDKDGKHTGSFKLTLERCAIVTLDDMEKPKTEE
jgi:hypothetical protein